MTDKKITTIDSSIILNMKDLKDMNSDNIRYLRAIVLRTYLDCLYKNLKIKHELYANISSQLTNYFENKLFLNIDFITISKITDPKLIEGIKSCGCTYKESIVSLPDLESDIFVGFTIQTIYFI